MDEMMEMRAKIAELEQHVKSNTHRINEFGGLREMMHKQDLRTERLLEKMENLVDTVTKLTATMEAQNREQNKRLDAIEHKSGNHWDTVIKAVISTIGTAIGGGIIAVIIIAMAG